MCKEGNKEVRAEYNNHVEPVGNVNQQAGNVEVNIINPVNMEPVNMNPVNMNPVNQIPVNQNPVNQVKNPLEKLEVKRDRSKSVDVKNFEEKIKKEMNKPAVYEVPEALSAINGYIDRILSDKEEAGPEFTELKSAAAKLKEALTGKQCKEREYNYYNELMAVYTASDKYYYSHNGFKWTSKGRSRRDLTYALSYQIVGLIKDNKVIQGIIVDEYKENELDKTETGKKLLKGLAILNAKKEIEAAPERQNELEYIDNVSDVTEKLITYTHRRELCTKAIEKAAGIDISNIKCKTGMDLSTMKDMLPVFKVNSDGTPATEKDAELLKKGVDMVNAFYGEDTKKRDAYLDEMIDKYLKISIDTSDYKPSMLEKDIEKYYEITNLKRVFKKIFDADSYNLEYLNNTPGKVMERTRNIEASMSAFSNMITKIYSNVYSFDVSSASIRLRQVDDNVDENTEKVYEHISKNEKVEFLSANEKGNEITEIIKSLFYEGDVVVKDNELKIKVDAAFDNGEISEENKNAVRNYIDESGIKVFVIEDSSTKLLKDFNHDFNQNEVIDGLKYAQNNAVVDDIYFERALEEAFVTNDQSGINEKALKVIKDYFLKYADDAHNMFYDDKMLNALAIGVAENVARMKYLSCHKLYDAVNKNVGITGDIDRVAGLFYKKVRYNENHKPLSPKDEENEIRNNDVLQALADNNTEKLYKYFDEFVDEYLNIKVNMDKLSPEHFFDDFTEKMNIAKGDLRISNIYNKLPGVIQMFKEKDAQKYQKFETKRNMILAYANLITNMMSNRYGIAVDKNRKEMIKHYEKTARIGFTEAGNTFFDMLISSDCQNAFSEVEKKAHKDKLDRQALEKKYQRNKNKRQGDMNGEQSSLKDKLTYNQGSEAEESDAEDVFAEIMKFAEGDFYRVPGPEEISGAIVGDEKKTAAYIILLETLATADSDYESPNKEIKYSHIADDFRKKVQDSNDEASYATIQYYIHAFKNAGEKVYLDEIDKRLSQDDITRAESKFLSQIAVKYHDTKLGVILRAAKKAEDDLMAISTKTNVVEEALKTAEDKGMNYHTEKLNSILYSEDKYKGHRNNLKDSRYSNILTETRKYHEKRAKAIGLGIFTPGDFVVYEEDAAEREVHLEADRKLMEFEAEKANLDEDQIKKKLQIINFEVNSAKYNIRKNERINTSKWEKIYQKKVRKADNSRIDLEYNRDTKLYENKSIDVMIELNEIDIIDYFETIENEINEINDAEFNEAYASFKKELTNLQEGLISPDEKWGGIDDECLAFRFERSYNELLNNVERVKKGQGKNVSPAINELYSKLTVELVPYFSQIALMGQKIDDIIYGQMSEKQDKMLGGIEKKYKEFKDGDRYKILTEQDIDKVFVSGDIEKILALGIAIEELIMIDEVVSADKRVIVDSLKQTENNKLQIYFIDKMNELPVLMRMDIIYGITGMINKYDQICAKEMLKNLGNKTFDNASDTDKKLAGEMLWFSENGIRLRAVVDMCGKMNPTMNSTTSEAVIVSAKIGGGSEYSRYIEDSFSENYSDANKFFTKKLTDDVKRDKIEPLKKKIHDLYNKNHMGFEYDDMEVGVKGYLVYENELANATPEQIIGLKNAAALQYEQLKYGTKKRRVLNEKAFKASREEKENNQIFKYNDGKFVEPANLPDAVIGAVINAIDESLGECTVEMSDSFKAVKTDFFKYLNRIKSNMERIWDYIHDGVSKNTEDRKIINPDDGWEDEMAVKMLEKRDAFAKALSKEAKRKAHNRADKENLNLIKENMLDGAFGAKLELIAPMIQKICDRVFDAGGKKDIEEAKKTDELIQKYIVNDTVSIPDENEIIRICNEGTVREKVALRTALLFAQNSFYDATLYGDNIEDEKAEAQDEKAQNEKAQNEKAQNEKAQNEKTQDEEKEVKKSNEVEEVKKANEVEVPKEAEEVVETEEEREAREEREAQEALAARVAEENKKISKIKDIKDIKNPNKAFDEFQGINDAIWEKMSRNMSAGDELEFASQLAYLERYYVTDIEKEYKELNGQPENAMLDININQENKFVNAFSEVSAKRNAVRSAILHDFSNSDYYINIEMLARFHGFNPKTMDMLTFSEESHRDDYIKRLKDDAAKEAVIQKIRKKVVDRCDNFYIPHDGGMIVDYED